MNVSSGKVRTAGRIEFVRDQGPVRRDIRVKDFEWRPDTLRNLTKILWAVERAHSYGIAALRIFSKMPSSEFSPDGLLGGRGYIQQVREMRSGLAQAVETLSSFTDTVHDEVNAPHWASVGEDQVSNEIMEDANEVKADPEGFVEDQFRQDVEGRGRPVPEQPDVPNPGLDPEEEPVSNPTPEEYNPFFEGDEDDSDWWNWDESPEERESPPKMSAYLGAGPKVADSSVPPETLPGPRVMHVGPGESPEEFGYFTDQNEVPSDDPSGEGFSQFDRIVESPVADGASGYENPTDGGESSFQVSAEAVVRSGATYSWLPGADNQKPLNYYEPGLTEAEVDWMRAHSDPDPPPGTRTRATRPRTDPLWETRRES